MSYRNRTSRFSTNPSFRNVTGSIRNSTDNYKREGTGVRRHEFQSDIGADSLSLNAYSETDLLTFSRTFTASADEDPTPTASNNYQTSSVMNGSKIVDFEANFKLKNKSSTEGCYLDVYSIVTSFSDATWLETVYGTETPIEMTTSGLQAGQVYWKAVPVTFTENGYKNYKGLQRHIKFLGTIYMSADDGGSTSAEFTIKGIPPKVRRSQTGMFYGLMFHYSGSKNTAAASDLTGTYEVKFKEIPASNRLPYKW